MGAPDDIAALPLTRDEMKLGLEDHLEAIQTFLHQYRKLLPPEMSSLEDLDEAVNNTMMELED